MEWISVEERLPEHHVSDLELAVLLNGKFKRVAYFYWDSYGKHWSCPYDPWANEWDGYVTHWMPLPDPPKEGE